MLPLHCRKAHRLLASSAIMPGRTRAHDVVSNRPRVAVRFGFLAAALDVGQRAAPVSLCSRSLARMGGGIMCWAAYAFARELERAAAGKRETWIGTWRGPPTLRASCQQRGGP